MPVQMDHEKLDAYPIELQFVAGGSVLAFYAGGRRGTPIRDRGRGRGRWSQKAMNPDTGSGTRETKGPEPG